MAITKATCNQCEYVWNPNVERPRKCPNPKCQSAYWNLPKKKKRLRKKNQEMAA